MRCSNCDSQKVMQEENSPQIYRCMECNFLGFKSEFIQ
jgi:hypothetical protein